MCYLFPSTFFFFWLELKIWWMPVAIIFLYAWVSSKGEKHIEFEVIQARYGIAKRSEHQHTCNMILSITCHHCTGTDGSLKFYHKKRQKWHWKLSTNGHLLQASPLSALDHSSYFFPLITAFLNKKKQEIEDITNDLLTDNSFLKPICFPKCILLALFATSHSPPLWSGSSRASLPLEF